jgi:hypothetical protein
MLGLNMIWSKQVKLRIESGLLAAIGRWSYRRKEQVKFVVTCKEW